MKYRFELFVAYVIYSNCLTLGYGLNNIKLHVKYLLDYFQVYCIVTTLNYSILTCNKTFLHMNHFPVTSTILYPRILCPFDDNAIHEGFEINGLTNISLFTYLCHILSRILFYLSNLVFICNKWINIQQSLYWLCILFWS